MSQKGIKELKVSRLKQVNNAAKIQTEDRHSRKNKIAMVYNYALKVKLFFSNTFKIESILIKNTLID